MTATTLPRIHFNQGCIKIDDDDDDDGISLSVITQRRPAGWILELRKRRLHVQNVSLTDWLIDWLIGWLLTVISLLR